MFTKEGATDYDHPLTRFSEEHNIILTDIDITRDRVLQKLKKLDPTKAPGVDGISSRVLVELAGEIAEPLAAIFQNSLETGEVPRSWKVADVVPIFKKGMKSVPGNYRQVSLTSHIGKLMGKFIQDEITSHLDRYDLLNDTQHGFMRGRSCLTNLLTYMEGVTRMLDEGKNVDIIYLDFAKAFDKIPHHRLIDKLASMGVEGRVKGWIQQWFEGRKQRVVINGRYSDWTDVTSGVPQGSVLGPTLFLVFINDLEDGVQSTVLKFAGDTKPYTEVTNEEGGGHLQEDLDWCTAWAKTMDDGVQFGKVQGTTCRKNKQNEGVHNGRKYSGKRTRGERLGSDGTQGNEWRQTGHRVSEEGKPRPSSTQKNHQQQGN